jgi:hypothetical protein
VVRATGWHAGDPGSILGRDGLYTFGCISPEPWAFSDRYVRYTKLMSFHFISFHFISFASLQRPCCISDWGSKGMQFDPHSGPRKVRLFSPSMLTTICLCWWLRGVVHALPSLGMQLSWSTERKKQNNNKFLLYAYTHRSILGASVHIILTPANQLLLMR